MDPDWPGDGTLIGLSVELLIADSVDPVSVLIDRSVELIEWSAVESVTGGVVVLMLETLGSTGEVVTSKDSVMSAVPTVPVPVGQGTSVSVSIGQVILLPVAEGQLLVDVVWVGSAWVTVWVGFTVVEGSSVVNSAVEECDIGKNCQCFCAVLHQNTFHQKLF